MKSIIFNQHQVNHALKNEEGMFRLVCKRQPSEQNKPYLIEKMVGGFSGRTAIAYPFGESPYQVGETIFVKEAFWQFGGYDSGYDSDEPKFIGSDKITFSEEEAAKQQTLCKGWKKRPAQHMKQEHSRLSLRIKSVKVERLQDISEEDAIKAGVEKCGDSYFPLSSKNNQDCCSSFKDAFKIDWNATHKKPEEKWEANPWVFAYKYEVIKK